MSVMNYARYLNPVSLARAPSPIRVLTELLSKSPPSMISLAGGQPNPDLFPFAEAHIKLRDGSQLHIDEKMMKVALQYGPSSGNADLVSWLRDLQAHLHDPPMLNSSNNEAKTSLCLTVGSMDGICKAFEALTGPGANVVLDNPTYPGTLGVLRPLGVNLLGIETDQDGMKPDALEARLAQWRPEEAREPGSDVPRLLYTIPNGVNPTGASLSLDRKQQIYKIAQLYDLLILEDDPYYFLQFGQTACPSLLSLDTDGRVVRFDSFSKVLSSGIRLGMVTGPHAIINKIMLHMMSSVMHTSSLSQIMVLELFRRWGIDGFLQHTHRVKDFYREQKDHLIAAAKKHLTGLAEWHEPVAGMFLWMKLLGIKDTRTLIEQKALAKQVMLVPGFVFYADTSQPSSYVRAAYSLASPQQMDTAMERLASLIKEETSTSI